tara:strand:+ start:39882 stop:40079 length:198 start_codon:yes stop_codon:yes gene_type:complete
MDRLDTPTDTGVRSITGAVQKPTISMTALRQNLLELRKHARRHDREDLTACLTLAISLASIRNGN